MDFGSETELDYEEEPQFSADENESPQGTFMGSRKIQNESLPCCDDDQYLQIDYLEEDENLPCSTAPTGTASTNINLSQAKVNSANHQLSNSTFLDNPSSQGVNDQNSFNFLNSQRVQQFQSGESSTLSVLNKKFQQLQPFSLPSFDFSQNQQDIVKSGKAQLQTSNMIKYLSSRNTEFCPNSVSGNIDYESNSEVSRSQGDAFRSRFSVETNKGFIDNSDCSKLQMNKKNNSNKGSNFSKDTEKELIRLKRVARLIRFANENSFQRRKTEGKKCHENLYFEGEYFRKMEEQKHKRQKIFELKEKQRRIRKPERGDKLMKFNTGQDTFLEKISPFCIKSGMTHIFDTNIKQEKYSTERETENFNLKERLHIIKCDFDSNVKFTRTISKTYEEMNLSRCSDKEITNTEPTSISVQAKMGDESQNSGCIVKVLNLPQVTMSDVVALCSPVGNPLEVKLNLVKENAVIVKFANPIFAANFYSLYHGVKVNGNFLNVVII